MNTIRLNKTFEKIKIKNVHLMAPNK